MRAETEVSEVDRPAVDGREHGEHLCGLVGVFCALQEGEELGAA